MLNLHPMLKNPELARRVIPPGGVTNHLRSFASGKSGPTKAERDKQKQEARLSLLQR
jgi:hypothetical protein